jgi:esterase/lipase
MENEVKVPFKVKALQWFFRIVGNIAPNAAIPVLIRFMFLPQKRPLKPPHIDCLNQGEQFFIDVHDFVEPAKTIKMSCYTWGSGSKIVLLVHGWDAKALDYYKMIPVLVERGYKVVAFDGPAHGQSEGELSNLIHFKEAIGKLIKITGKPYAIIGHSMGGGSSAYFLIEEEVRIERLVLLATPIVSKRFFDVAFDYMKIPKRMRKTLFNSMEEKFGKPIEYYNLAERPEPIKADKILFVYEEKDEEIPTDEVLHYLSLHPEIQRMSTNGVGHNRVMKDKRVIDAVAEFLG